MDWATISALATGFGTLVLAVATFASVRSANRAARTAERALSFNLRPLLFSSRTNDPMLKVTWMDGRMHRLEGGHAIADVTGESIYLAMSLRNAGAGMAVLQSWSVWTDTAIVRDPPKPLDTFRQLTRDLYIAPNDVGFWQGAVRDRNDELFAPLAAHIRAREGFAIDLLYFNAEGGQQTVSRFQVVPIGDDAWICTVGRHFSLDHELPR
jgi:hypothetical protein